MVQTIRAIYEDGQLKPLEPLDLSEGQTVNISIETEFAAVDITPDEVDARLRAAGLLVEWGEPDGEELTPEERHRIGRLFVADRRVEDLIDEERGLY